MIPEELQPRALSEIIAFYLEGTRDDELDGSALHQVDTNSRIDANTRFYVLPIPDFDENDQPDWEALGPDIASLAVEHGLFDGILGEHLSNTLHLVRNRAADSSPDQIAAAFDYYLEHDAWPDWLA